MKKAKRIFSAMLAVMLLAALLVIPASAAGETYTITIHNANAGHTYAVYQIFGGTLSQVGAAEVLSDIVWGSGVSGAEAALGNAATKAASLTEENVAAFAKEVAEYLTTPTATQDAQSDITIGSSTHKAYVISGLQPGYYLVKDIAVTGENDAYTSYILAVVSNVTVEPKGSLPTVTKQVADINDSTNTARDGWHDSADHDIGDAVEFQMIGTLPSNYSEYSSYKYIVHDKMDAGLSFNKESVKVLVDGVQINEGYTVVTEGITDGCSFHIQFDNLKAIAAVTATSHIVVDYTARLNENAGLGNNGANKNTVQLEYSNDPYDAAHTGKTVADTVKVFTYQLVLEKVDKNYQDLTGAAFKVEKYEKEEGKWITLGDPTLSNDASTFTFKGVDAGFYRVTETQTPAGYNSIAPFILYIDATHQIEDAADPQLLTLSSGLTNENGDALASTSDQSFGTAKVAEGSVPVIIINSAGATLPETGGIGTTIFYVIGAVLVIGAATVLVSKKRGARE